MTETDKTNLLDSPRPLLHLGLLRIYGKDAENFLQGQLTCDIKLLTEKTGLPAAYCSPKGRAIASLQVIKKNKEDFLLILAKDLLKKVKQRLTLFIMRSELKIDDLTLTHSINGLIRSREIDNRLLDNLVLPEESNQVSLSDSEIILKLSGTPARFIIISEDTSSPKEREMGLTNFHNLWILNDINNGISLITSESSEHHIPQMFNLDRLGGISFKKGCYTGQEIIARMHYLGKLKQRTFLASTACKNLPDVGTAVFDNNQKVGELLMVATDEEHKEKVKLLVVMQISHLNSKIYLKNSPNSPLIFEDLPYTFSD